MIDKFNYLSTKEVLDQIAKQMKKFGYDKKEVTRSIRSLKGMCNNDLEAVFYHWFKIVL